jgi:hypothetical protein
MLFKQVHLKGILTGKISLAFRKWNRPSVKRGSIIKTSIGQLEIQDFSVIDKNAITNSEAVKAGYQDLSELMAIIDSRKGSHIYRIKIRYHSPDPRIELRNKTDLSAEEFKALEKKLTRMDSLSSNGAWTIQVLETIKDRPNVKAQKLADVLGKEKEWLKPNIRKLKNMGLTISHSVGYSLSPLGKVILDRMTNE